MNIYDLIIVGGGPAGITAAIYAARQKINTLVITKDIGGQAAWSGNIENYTGYQFISGPELASKFEEHLERFNIILKMPEEVISIDKQNQIINIKTNRDNFQSKTLIIACGKSPRLLNVPGEKEFKNKGVTYCAICDGPIFSGKDVAVIGGGNSALDAASQMTKIARKVYLININATLGGETVLREKVSQAKNIEILNSAIIKRIIGDKFVNSIEIDIGGKTTNIPLQGIFIEIGLTPVSNFINIVEKNSQGEIIVDNRCATNIPGIFAAGDVSNVPEKQIIIAAGEGSKAALSAAKYLSTQVS